MAENEAYKVLKDVSIPRALRETDQLVNGEKLYETEGRTYAEGQYVMAADITPPLREKAEAGELDYLEPVSGDEAREAQRQADRAGRFDTFIPEHENETVILRDYGHEVVPRDQVLELKSAGSDEAKAAIEASREDGFDERPGITADEVPSLAKVSRGEEQAVVPKESQAVDVPSHVEQPPGLNVGDNKEAAEADPNRPARSKRSRPSKKQESSDSGDGENKS